MIDWQSGAALPLFYQCGVPKMFRHSEPVSLDLFSSSKLPDNYKNLQPDERDYAEKMQKSEFLHQFHLRLTSSNNPRHWTAIQLHDEVRVQPVRIVHQVCENNTIFFLRRALMRIANSWERLCPDAGPCPVTFTEQDYALYTREVEKREFVSDTLSLFQIRYGLEPDGTVYPNKYAEMQAELKQIYEMCLEAAEDEEERLDVERLWPYQDTVDSTLVTTSRYRF